MKVRFTIQKGKETLKTGMLSSKEVDMYNLTATFTPSEFEKKIYNEHPLFKLVNFMVYSEVDKFATGFLNLGAQQTVDMQKAITVGMIYNSPTFAFRAYSCDRIIELRSLILEAGDIFADSVKALQSLIGSDEIEFKAKNDEPISDKPRDIITPDQNTLPLSKFCPSCNSKIEIENAKFCDNCGAKI
jgi:hypothetical protein